MRNAASFDSAYRAAQRAYERGRLGSAVRQALVLAAVAAFLAWNKSGSASLPWIPLTLASWTAICWHGTSVLRGGRVGAIAGLVTIPLPHRILHPCCSTEEMAAGAATCCRTMYGTCGLAGLAIGIMLALLLPRGPVVERWRAAAGMATAALSVASLRCAGLVLGETVGLLGGLLAGILASAAVSTWIGRRTPAI